MLQLATFFRRLLQQSVGQTGNDLRTCICLVAKEVWCDAREEPLRQSVPSPAAYELMHDGRTCGLPHLVTHHYSDKTESTSCWGIVKQPTSA